MVFLARFLLGKGSLFIRTRNINIALFVVAFIIMTLVMLSAFTGIVNRVSADYASRYAASSADAFSANIIKEVGLMSKAARSSAVIDWFEDEKSVANRAHAFDEISEIVGELYSNNVYVGVKSTGNEYYISDDTGFDSFLSDRVYDENNPDDAWFFNTLNSENDYVLSVAMDNVLDQKRVWLNYKVRNNGETLGVLSTGLAFSHIVGELFSQYDNVTLRGLIIDADGNINMDSKLLFDPSFHNQDFETQIDNEFTDPVLLSAIRAHLSERNGVYEEKDAPIVMTLQSGPYKYATIDAIKGTSWSAVILYDPSSSVNISLFLPVIAILLVLLILFALATNATSSRLIFKPLDKLMQSLVHLKEDNEEGIYGLEREDEIGHLSNTIVDLFTKANYDALTGIHNRRFLENSFQNILHMLSRSDGTLSVIMLDIDFFKKYNDTYGHDQGDVCLRAVAQALAGTITRKGDFAARYGGEEFTVVLPNTDEDGARLVAGKLLESVRGLALPHEASDTAEYVTVSIGVTTGNVIYTHSWDDYIKRADEALYMSKQSGRNQYTFLAFENEETAGPAAGSVE